jgi:hypothetical protein
VSQRRRSGKIQHKEGERQKLMKGCRENKVRSATWIFKILRQREGVLGPDHEYCSDTIGLQLLGY